MEKETVIPWEEFLGGDDGEQEEGTQEQEVGLGDADNPRLPSSELSSDVDPCPSALETSCTLFQMLGISEETDVGRYGGGDCHESFADEIESPDAFLLVSQIDLVPKVIWDAEDPQWNYPPDAKAGSIPSTDIMLQSPSSERQGPDFPFSSQTTQPIRRPFTDLTNSTNTENEDGQFGQSLWEYEPELQQSYWENNVVWDAENIPDAGSSNHVPKPWTIDLNDENASIRRYLPKDVRPSTSGTNPPKKAFPHKQSTEKLFGILQGDKERELENSARKTLRKDPIEYNISNDKYYSPKLEALKSMTRLPMPHATPLIELRPPFIPTHLGPRKLRKFHRPSVNLLVNGGGLHGIRALTKNISKKAKAREADRMANGGKDFYFMRTAEDLSGKDGTLVLIEYCEQYPPLLSQIGMCSKIVNYFKRSANRNEKPPVMKLGENVVTHTSPFLAPMHPGQILHSIENNLYCAPIYEHNNVGTDFILVITKSAKSGFSIREYNHLFTAGQECPFIEVPNPNSRMATKYAGDLLQVFIFRMFCESRATPKKLDYQVLKGKFPLLADSTIRKRLKSCADLKRAGADAGCWILKEDFRLPSEDEIRALITPDQCCAYFSYLAGEQRLRDAGYGADSVFSLEDENGKTSNEKIEDEVNFAPWNTTKAFLGASMGKFILDVNGQADPTGIGEGFSYIRQANRQNSKEVKEQVQMQKQLVRGTDGDLRKLGLPEARQVLRKFGIPEPEIQKLNRWESIDLVRTLSTRTAKKGDGTFKFSRGKLSTPAMNMERFKEDCQRIFDVQNRVLSADTPLTSDEEGDSSSDEVEGEGGNMIEEMSKNVEQMLFENKTGEEYAFEREELERKELRKMILNNEFLEGDKALAKSEERDKEISSLSSKPGRILRIQRLFTHPADGRHYTRTELVRSPAVIDIYLRMRATKNDDFIKKFVFSGEEETLRKEKRRLQAQIRKMKGGDNLKKRVYPKKVKDPKDLMPPPKITCSSCGQSGHMRTNRNCPNFTESSIQAAMTEKELETEEERKLNGIEGQGKYDVKLDGTKFLVTGKLASSIEEIRRQSVTIKVQRDDLEKFKKKRQPDEFDYYRRHPQTNNRLRLDPQVMISNIFEEILNEMREKPIAVDFIKPVGKKVPNYYEMIQTPMCIQFMRDKIRNRQYESRGDFLKDAKLLVDNSVTYNGDKHLVTVYARKIYQIAESRIEERSTELHKYEILINPLLDEDSKRKLSYILNKIVEQIKLSPDAYPFLRPVSKKTQTYYDVIEHPMDLELIGIKIEQFVYKSRYDFLKDIDLIHFNAVKFNGLDHPIVTQATELSSAIHDALRPLDGVLTDLEISIKKNHKDNGIDHGERELEPEPIPGENLAQLEPDRQLPPSPVVMPLDFHEPWSHPPAENETEPPARKRSRTKSAASDGNGIQDPKKLKMEENATVAETESESRSEPNPDSTKDAETNEKPELPQGESGGIHADLEVSDSSGEE